ncbi:hypothetical protein ZIOFF_035236 [Zingiber officinale]|uniref:non-specific serine/threonine protein kinase n=1 Tax=Zingiber officinale TaxID=94328 RepID=A0A8J5L2I5_ZINOF|nr:hypothetical protein ZIOFF_035236 [Zingiber officinale]
MKSSSSSYPRLLYRDSVSVASYPQSRRSGERPEGERDAAIHLRIFAAYDRARIRFELRVSWRRDGEIRVPKGHWVWELWSHQVDEEQGDEGARRRQVPTQRGNGSIDDKVVREIVNHRSLRHPNIIQFMEVMLTPTHLVIVMEYAAGGELFERICSTGRFSEDEARYFFQQLICGVSYCHQLQVCHRDLKLENTLLDGSPSPKLKICDFGYSKSTLLHSQPKSAVGTPAYIAPEILAWKEYDGKMADVWSCGVTLYVMLVGAYPFEDPNDTKNFRKTIERIRAVRYKIPPHVHISPDCKHLLSQIFVANPARRITMQEIKNHIWYLKNLPRELTEAAQANYGYLCDSNVPTSSTGCLQSVIEIMQIVKEARIPPPVSQSDDEINWENDEPEEQEGEQDKSKNKEEKQHSTQKGKEHERSAQKGNDEQESSARNRKEEEH